MKSLIDLRLWNEALELAALIYRETRVFPKEERFGLTAQLRKAAVSVPSNIAEGQGRLTLGEWRHFLGVARGSLYEVETDLHLASKLGFLEADNLDTLLKGVTNVRKNLGGLIRYLERRQAADQKKASANPHKSAAGSPKG